MLRTLKNQMESLSELAAKYKAVKSHVNDRREEWSATTRDFLVEQLSQCADEIGEGWYVDDNNDVPNWGSLVLCEPVVNSGIRLGSRNLVRQGGYLAFSQAADGRMTIWMRFAFVEELEVLKEDKQLKVVQPNDIDAGIVSKYVSKFMSELIDQAGKNRPKIGFNQ